jgi:nicotinic acid mononucleotide adenylyltransferase
MTKTMLARPNDELFSPVQRVDLLTRITAQENLGLLLANRGTYLDVSRALRTAAVEATFVIGSDKLPQLADPAFYADGEHGVAATFAEVRLVVVPRDGTEVDRDDVAVIDPREVFPAGTRDERLARLSGTEIRRKVAAGEPVEDLVPQAVAVALGGYTAAR